MTDQNTVTNAGSALAASLIRHAMTALSGVLGTAGALTSDQQTQFVSVGTALVLYGAAQAWSFVQKRNLKR